MFITSSNRVRKKIVLGVLLISWWIMYYLSGYESYSPKMGGVKLAIGIEGSSKLDSWKRRRGEKIVKRDHEWPGFSLILKIVV